MSLDSRLLIWSLLKGGCEDTHSVIWIKSGSIHRFCESGNETLGVMQSGKYTDHLDCYQWLQKNSVDATKA